jgi:hypothetical protein
MADLTRLASEGSRRLDAEFEVFYFTCRVKLYGDRVLSGGPKGTDGPAKIGHANGQNVMPVMAVW